MSLSGFANRKRIEEINEEGTLRNLPTRENLRRHLSEGCHFPIITLTFCRFQCRFTSSEHTSCAVKDYLVAISHLGLVPTLTDCYRVTFRELIRPGTERPSAYRLHWRVGHSLPWQVRRIPHVPFRLQYLSFIINLNLNILVHFLPLWPCLSSLLW